MITAKELSNYGLIIFDYDSTIAKVPIDWPKARVAYQTYLKELFPRLKISNGARVDEMESIALRNFPAEQEAIFNYRLELESSLDGQHEPIRETVELLHQLTKQDNKTLVIISNNLNRTVASGLQQLDLVDAFTTILGVDDVGEPKPAIKAFTILKEKHPIPPDSCYFIGDNHRTDGGFCQQLGIPFFNIKQD